MSSESFRIGCSKSTEWDSPLESLADWGRRSWTDRHTGAIYVPQLFGQRHRLGLQDRTRRTGLPRRSWAQVLLASGQGILIAYFTCHIQSLMLHSSFFFLPSSTTCYVLDYLSLFLGSTQPSMQLVLRGSSPGYSRRGVKPTVRLAKIKNVQSCTSTDPYVFMAYTRATSHFGCLLCFSVMFFPISIHVTFTFLH